MSNVTLVALILMQRKKEMDTISETIRNMKELEK